MEAALVRIMALLNIIHNENMTIYRMFLGKKADEIISGYEKHFDEVLKMDIDME